MSYNNSLLSHETGKSVSFIISHAIIVNLNYTKSYKARKKDLETLASVEIFCFQFCVEIKHFFGLIKIGREVQ